MIGVGLGLQFQQPRKRKKEYTSVKDGLVAEYLFDEGEGQILTDYGGNGNHGMLGSTPDADTNDPLWVPEGLSFDGVDDFAEINLPAITNDFTVGLVICPTKDIDLPEFIFTNRRTTTSSCFSVLLLTENRTLAIDFGGLRWTTTVNLQIGQWVYLRLTRSENKMELYKNDILQDALASGGDLELANTGDSFLLGQNGQERHYFGGGMACLAIYSRLLTSSENRRNKLYLQTLLAERGVTLE